MLLKRARRDSAYSKNLEPHVGSQTDRPPASLRRTYRSRIRRCLPWFLSLAFFQTILFMFIGSIADLDNKPLHESPFAHLTRRNQQKDKQVYKEDSASRKLSPPDNYTSRKHITSKKSILIVGGSDGSGTRSFVDILGRVGVPMILDDGGTLDVHAQALYAGKGWPPLIQAVLDATHSANYEWDELPTELQETITEQMEKFNLVYMKRGEALLKKLENKTLAKHISFGFKAPATMLLLPVLRHVYGSIKFLHVVRDGRDVSFSENVSPVQKFYDTYYTDFKERRALYEKPAGNESLKEVMQMQLWNDWNTQVHEWAQAHSDGVTFDYLVMRTEDLVNPETRLATLTQLADFVGSPKTNDELCCLSRRPLADMGKSSSRYGSRARLLDQLNRDRLKLPGNNPIAHHDPALFAKLQQDRDRIQRISRPEGNSALNPDLVLRTDLIHRKLLDQEPQIKDAEKSENSTNEDQQNKDKDEIEVPTDAHSQQTEPEKQKKPTEVESANPLLEVPRGKDSRTQREKAMLSKYTDEKKRKAVEEMLKRRKMPPKRHQESPEQVKSRYGKWVERLAGKPQLSRLLHEHGAAGLRLFGYEPRTQFMDTPATRITCDASIVCQDS